ncbi:immunoglobulin superfamily member 1-like [Notamacropus eugenii]|uniref:immunoglobulin superfamily member 1-like n=1 Tax=Notamacropus eugenii TaxID=9315 RepID=UPI003B672596
MGPTFTFLLAVDPLPRPTLWAIPSPVVPMGADMTLRCQGHLWSERFQLWKDGEFQDERNAFWQQAEFVLRNVEDWRDARSYRCRSGQGLLWSELSEALPLVVTGSLPKPSLSALPGLVVEPGIHVTLQCRQPPQTLFSGMTFTLLKVGTPQPLQSQSPAGTLAIFPLLSVSAQDAGNYSCIYQETTAPYKVSAPSEVLEIWVTDALPKPSLSAWPASEVKSGDNVTLLCQGPSGNCNFVLYKDRDEKILVSMHNTRGRAKFFLNHVIPKNSGNCSCGYQLLINGGLWTQYSEPLQLIVTGIAVEPGLQVPIDPSDIPLEVTFTLLRMGTIRLCSSRAQLGLQLTFPSSL